MMQFDIVVDGVDVRLARVDDIVDLAVVHELGDLLGRLEPVDTVTSMPRSEMTFAVPAVAYSVQPRSANFLAMETISNLS